MSDACHAEWDNPQDGGCGKKADGLSIKLKGYYGKNLINGSLS